MTVCTNSADALYSAIDHLLNDKMMSRQMGEHAYQVLKQNQGALHRLLAIINRYLTSK